MKRFLVNTVLIIAAFLLLSPSVFAIDVGLYDTFEFSVSNSNNYSNPFDYDEIELKASFTSPSGKSFSYVPGFYDGGTTWKIRFMPDEKGTWNYTYSWVGTGTKPSGGNGSFIVGDRINAKNHGHVKVDSTFTRYLRYDDGTPHYFYGSKWIAAENYGPASKNGETNTAYLSDTQLLSYLNSLESYNHNGILIKTALYPLEYHTTRANTAADKLKWDLSWIQRGEWFVKEALKRGIYVQVNMFDTWSRWNDFYFRFEQSGHEQVFNVWADGDEKAKRNYIKTLVARYSGFANVYWELGNEMEHTNTGSNFATRANSLYIPWIREFDPYDLPMGLSEDIWKSTSVDIGFLHQATGTADPANNNPQMMNELVACYDCNASLWEDVAIRDSYNRYAYRNTFWRMFAYGGVGSSEATWLELSTALNQSVVTVMNDHKVFRTVVESIPININEMYPVSRTIERGVPNTNITYGRRSEGKVYFYYIYASKGASISATQNLEIDLSFFPGGTYVAKWIDTKNGNTVLSQTFTDRDDTTRFQAIPNPAFTEDIALIIQNTNLGSITPSPTPTTGPTATPTLTPTTTPTRTPTPTPQPTAGDTDGDNDVDIFDYNAVISHFGAISASRSEGDLDGDSDVDIFDYNLVISNFGRGGVTPTPTSIGSVSITNIQSFSGRSYVPVPNGLQNGALVFTDRDYMTFTTVPTQLIGQTYIKTANEDNGDTVRDNFLSFTIDKNATIYVALDNRKLAPPSWTADWTNTGIQIISNAYPEHATIYSKQFPAGTVSLGANEGGGSMYSVIVVP